jgi:hypothetical protein
LKASLGSVDFVTSFCKSEDESKKIKDAVNASSYGSEFVHAALSVNQKVMFLIMRLYGGQHSLWNFEFDIFKHPNPKFKIHSGMCHYTNSTTINLHTITISVLVTSATTHNCNQYCHHNQHHETIPSSPSCCQYYDH